LEAWNWAGKRNLRELQASGKNEPLVKMFARARVMDGRKAHGHSGALASM